MLKQLPFAIFALAMIKTIYKKDGQVINNTLPIVSLVIILAFGTASYIIENQSKHWIVIAMICVLIICSKIIENKVLNKGCCKMNKNSTIVDFTKFLSAFLFGFVILGILTFALDVEPFQITPSFIFVNGSRFITLLISSLYFLLSNTSVSFKTKLFPSTKKFYKFLDSLLIMQMLFALCTCLLTLQFSLLEGVFTSAYALHNIAFAVFFVVLYISNKISINKVVVFLLGGVYIGFWYAYNFFADYINIDISDIIPVIIIAFYMLFFGLFPTPSLKSLFYYNVIEVTFNDEETEMICISATKNDIGEIEMLMITDRQEYMIYNRSTKEKTIVDEDNYMSINEDLQKDLGLFIICNK